MRGNKIDAPNLFWKGINFQAFLSSLKTPVRLMAMGVFLLPAFGCVMTKAQGDRLHQKVNNLEDEVAKLQSVRHDMEVLLVGQVKDLIDRIARLESQLSTFKESLYEGSSRNTELLAELQNLRGELETAQNRYRNLETDQQNLAKNQIALKEAQSKTRVPPLKEDHFALAKKYHTAKKFDEATALLEQFVKDYPNDPELNLEAHYYLGDSLFNLAGNKQDAEDQDIFYKKSVMSFQKVIEANKNLNLSAESLFKLGLALKALDNTEGALLAFKELLAKHKKSSRIKEAKIEIVALEKNKK